MSNNSKRESLMYRVVEFVNSNSLNTVYSGDGYSDTKKWRYVLFNAPRTLDGEVRIYGETFIMIKYQTAYRSLPARDTRVFDCIENALQFMKLAFVQFKFDEALSIPVRS